MPQMTKLESLLEMGFDRNRVERALANTKDQGIEEAMDWLMEHEDDPEIDEAHLPPAEKVEEEAATIICTSDSTQADIPEDTENEEKVQIAPDETKKRKRPLTEEEHERVKRLEELMRMQQGEELEEEPVQEVEREKMRRRQGREGLKTQAERYRKDKTEDKQFRQRVSERIAERDRERRIQKTGGGGPTSTAVRPEPSPTSPTSEEPPPSKKEYQETKIQVRLFDGSAITAVFKAHEPLAAVCVYVKENSNMAEDQEFTMLSPYPRHVYSEQDMKKPLRELGLVPSAVLVLTKKLESLPCDLNKVQEVD